MAEARKLFRRSKPLGHASVRGTTFHINRADESTSRQIAYTDDFLSLATFAGATVVIPTAYNIARLFQIIEQSNMVAQCIDAYVTNTVQTGWEVEAVNRGRIIDAGEQVELESFLEHANSEEALTDVMEKVIRDREAVGFGFLEVISDRTGDVSILRHCPAMWTRLCVKHPAEQLVEYTVTRGRRVSTVKEFRRFRRFVQIVNGEYVWFKEFGDPRQMDYTNGAFEGDPGFNPANLATSLIHFKNPSNDPYGVPRWINQLPSIIGSREAEEVNMRYFQDNTVPPMLLMVGNGRLTQQSYRELTKMLNEKDIGSVRQNKIMLLEAVGEGDSMDGKNSAIELKVEKLTDARQSDGLFSDYDDANMAKVRSSFRLPPITVGMSQDINFATATTSVFVAESQVFGPARVKIDNTLNKLLFNGRDGMRLATVKVVSRIPAITSPEMMIKTLTALNVMGAVTPREAQKAANKVLQVEITPYPEKGENGYDDWMDAPLVITAQKQVKKQAELAAKAAAQAKKEQINAQGEIAKTHDGQALKDVSTKKVEKTGNVEQLRPKNGQN